MESLSIHTLFLAQTIGLYLVIISAIKICRRKLYVNLIKSMTEPNLSLMIWGALGLIVGLCLIDIHNIWEYKPRVLITLVGWYILIKSVLWLAFPEKMIAYAKQMAVASWYYATIAFSFIIGALLLAKGYFLYIY